MVNTKTFYIFAEKVGIMVKNKEYILKEFPLPNCLHEVNREDLQMFASTKKGVFACMTLQEIFHLYDYLYDVVRTARYDYFLSCKQKYSTDYTLEDEDEQWIQYHYLCNSLMWYNASFDVILQCVWIFYGLYYNKQEKNYIRTSNVRELQKQCSFDMINEHERKDLIDSKLLKRLRKLRGKRDKIAEYVNKLKHSGLITKGGGKENFFLEVKQKTGTLEDGVIYDSSCTQEEIDPRKAEQSIKNYHNALISFIEFMNEIFMSKVMKF